MQNSCFCSSILPFSSLGNFSCVSKLIWSAKSLLAGSLINLFWFYMMTCLHFMINDFLKINTIVSQKKASESVLLNSSLVNTPSSIHWPDCCNSAVTYSQPQKIFLHIFGGVNTLQCSESVIWSKESFGTNVYNRQRKKELFFGLDWKFIRVSWIQP